MFGKILIATDGSAASTRAMERAIDMAARDHSELLALTVVPRKAMHYFDGVSVPTPETLDSAEADSLRDAQILLDIHASHAKASQVAFSTQTVVSDTVADVIITASRDYGSDLIVMGTSERSGLARLLGGSKTQRVVASSDVPVLVVH